MNNTLCRILTVLCVALAVVLLGTVSVAQNVFLVDPYANANTPGAPDGTLRITNTGATYENLCAMIYVFTADQQMAECCGCLESPDNLNTLSVNNDLTSNPLTSTIPTTGVIKIVPTTVNDAPCDARQYTPIVLTVILDNWIVFPVVVSDPLHILIEFKSVPVGLSSQELAALQSQCTFIGILGSGRGICTCGSGSS